MPTISAQLKRKNLFVEISAEGRQEWTCICYGECEENLTFQLEDTVFNIGKAYVAATFEDRDELLTKPDLRDWERDFPNGAIHINLDENCKDHYVQMTVPIPRNLYDLVRFNDFSSNDLVVSLEYESFDSGHGRSAYAFAVKTRLHFLSK
jgi:hypothetical protein